MWGCQDKPGCPISAFITKAIVQLTPTSTYVSSLIFYFSDTLVCGCPKNQVDPLVPGTSRNILQPSSTSTHSPYDLTLS